MNKLGQDRQNILQDLQKMIIWIATVTIVGKEDLDKSRWAML